MLHQPLEGSWRKRSRYDVAHHHESRDAPPDQGGAGGRGSSWRTCSTCCSAMTTKASKRPYRRAWQGVSRPARLAITTYRNVQSRHTARTMSSSNAPRGNRGKEDRNRTEEKTRGQSQRDRPALRGDGAAHHADTRVELHALRHERPIVSRAIPEIDGFKPSHQKAALYHVQDGAAERQPRQKIGEHRRPDHEARIRTAISAIYETMVRLARGQ